MATLAFPSAGSKLYICTSNATPTTFDAAGFAAQTYVEVKELTNIGVIGKVFTLITHEPVGDPTTYKFKGTSNSGQLALQGAYAPTDPGQAKLLIALDDPLVYSFKLTIGGGATGLPQATNKKAIILATTKFNKIFILFSVVIFMINLRVAPEINS